MITLHWPRGYRAVASGKCPLHQSFFTCLVHFADTLVLLVYKINVARGVHRNTT